MKRIYIFLITLFIATFFAKAQEEKIVIDTKGPCECDTLDTRPISLKLNNGENVTISKQRGTLIDVSQTKQAQHRKMFDCPDVLAKPVVEKEPEIEVAKPEIETKTEIKQPDKKPFFLTDPVFFRINKSVIDPSEWAKIELAVNYLRENPRATVVVTGYADKKTGNTQINLRLSEQRSNAVAKAMEEKYGVSKNRISVNWRGDGLQPFEFDNDKNRAVLFLINP